LTSLSPVVTGYQQVDNSSDTENRQIVFEKDNLLKHRRGRDKSDKKMTKKTAAGSEQRHTLYTVA